MRVGHSSIGRGVGGEGAYDSLMFQQSDIPLVLKSNCPTRLYTDVSKFRRIDSTTANNPTMQ